MSKREDICARILEILGGLERINIAARGLDQFPEGVAPAAVLKDGMEVFPPESRTEDVLNGKAPLVIMMSPVVAVKCSDLETDISTTANQLLADVQNAILCDDELKDIVQWPIGKVVYDGLDDPLISHAMAQTCDLIIRFEIHYILNPQNP